MNFDYLVIGGGSGGIASARRAASHGAKVGLIEKGTIGGTCVNVGCVPKKIMWFAANFMDSLSTMKGYGIDSSGSKFDWPTLVKNRDAYIRTLNSIYDKNLEGSQVARIQGEAKFISPKEVEVEGKTYKAEQILIATGGRPAKPKFPGSELGVTSDDFFRFKTLPKKIVVIGAGYIAVELSGVLNSLGAETHLVIRKDSVLRQFDQSLQEELCTAIQESKMKLHTNSSPVELKKNQNGKLDFSFKSNQEEVLLQDLDHVLFATGRSPNTENLGLEKTEVQLGKKGEILVNEWEETNQKGIYALGDVIGKVDLTPVAIAAGRNLSDRIFGKVKTHPMNYQDIPTVIFSHPPIGTVGQTEDQARKEYKDVKVYQTRFTNMYFGLADKKESTLLKLIVQGEDEILVGAHLIGKDVDEMLQPLAPFVKHKLPKKYLDDTTAIHPTSGEELVLLR